MPCSRIPARTVSAISSWLRTSITVDSMPALASRWESISPAGPAPMMATWVVMVFRAMAASRFVAGPGGQDGLLWHPVCGHARVTGVTVIPLNGFRASPPRRRAMPRAAVCSAGTSACSRISWSGTTTPSAATARCRRSRTGTAMPQVSGSTTPASWAKPWCGCFGQQRADIVAGQPSRRDRRTGQGSRPGSPFSWCAISTSPAEEMWTGIRPATFARLATEPRRESRSTNKGLPPVQHRQVHVLVEDLLDVLHERHGRLPQGQGRASAG